jgi:predicted ribosome quality control (RQC) complex YloA/Tae2 family protein
MDRVIDLQFGRDEFAAHIIVELYAQGNIILTDENYTILSLLRSYTLDGAPTKDENDEGPARCAVKEKYPFSAAANLTEDNIITDPVEIKRIIND